MKPIGDHGITHSSWNASTRRWDYWRAPQKLRAGVIAPRPRMAFGSKLGLAPEQAARPLPAGAVRAGAGEHARGLVARPSGMGAADLDSGLIRTGLMILAGYVLLRHVSKGR